jgi:thiamine-phosphate pyrophosphorylase
MLGLRVTNLAEQARRLNRGADTGFALLTDRERLADPLPLLALLPPGSLVVLRHYGAPERLALARALARACRTRRLRLVVGDDLDLAGALGVGLHLREAQARAPAPRIRLWHRRTHHLLTAAAHGPMALRRARRLGADLAFVSPVFATASHPATAPLGLVRFRSLTRRAPLPVWALGGVSLRTVRRLRGARTAGIATVGNLL